MLRRHSLNVDGDLSVTSPGFAGTPNVAVLALLTSSTVVRGIPPTRGGIAECRVLTSLNAGRISRSGLPGGLLVVTFGVADLLCVDGGAAVVAVAPLRSVGGLLDVINKLASIGCPLNGFATAGMCGKYVCGGPIAGATLPAWKFWMARTCSTRSPRFGSCITVGSGVVGGVVVVATIPTRRFPHTGSSCEKKMDPIRTLECVGPTAGSLGTTRHS